MMNGGMMTGGFGPNWWIFGGIGMLLSLLFWVVLIVGAIYLIKELLLKGQPHYTDHTDTALEILRKRYASGEINKEEFEQKRQELLQ